MMMLAIGDDLRVYLLIATTLGIFVVLWFLAAMFRREAVKRDLHQRGCKPIHVWWSPLAYWVPFGWDMIGFRVVYSDASGFVHKAYCYVSRNWLAPVLSARRMVTWLKDEITGQLPAPEVWVDSEIIRPKLKEQNPRADNLPEIPEKSSENGQ